MKRIIIWFFIFLLFVAYLHPYQKTTQVLEFKEDGSQPVYTLNCHKDYHIFIEVDRREKIKLAYISQGSDWEFGQDGCYIWLKPKKGANASAHLTLLTESGKLYQFKIEAIEDAESLYLKTFITGGENEW